MQLFLRTAALLLFSSFACLTQAQPRILTNQVGYEATLSKRAVVMADTKLDLSTFRLINDKTNQSVYQGAVVYSGPVGKWKNWQFWTLDFSSWRTEGTYKLEIQTPSGAITSYPFIIGKNVLEKATLSDVIYYFKGQRSAGLIDQADHHLPAPPQAQRLLKEPAEVIHVGC